MTQLLYHQRTNVTGRKLADYLGLPHGVKMRDTTARPDYLVRWGTAVGVPLRPAVRTFNTRAAISAASNKLTTLNTLLRAGVSIPRFNTDVNRLNFPMLGRRTNTQGGKEITLLLQPADLQFMKATPDFYVEFVKKIVEYRIHVIGGRIAKTQVKEFRGDRDDYDPVVWNHDAGWYFRQAITRDEVHPGTAQAITAVAALGLDFGAVDLIIGDDDKPYVLEVNTAPGLCKTTLPLYGAFLAEGMRLLDVPGYAAVQWEDEPNE